MVDWSDWTSSLDRQAWWVGGGICLSMPQSHHPDPGEYFLQISTRLSYFPIISTGSQETQTSSPRKYFTFCREIFFVVTKKVFQYFAMSKIVPPLVDGHLLLILVTDHEPDDSPEPPDQVEQGQHQPHHVHLGEDVV